MKDSGSIVDSGFGIPSIPNELELIPEHSY